jgi:hypothetical protein
MYEEFDLVGFVPDQLFPRFPIPGEASDQQLSQQGLQLGLWVYDPQPSLGGREH